MNFPQSLLRGTDSSESPFQLKRNMAMSDENKAMLWNVFSEHNGFVGIDPQHFESIKTDFENIIVSVSSRAEQLGNLMNDRDLMNTNKEIIKSFKDTLTKYTNGGDGKGGRGGGFQLSNVSEKQNYGKARRDEFNKSLTEHQADMGMQLKAPAPQKSVTFLDENIDTDNMDIDARLLREIESRKDIGGGYSEFVGDVGGASSNNAISDGTSSNLTTSEPISNTRNQLFSSLKQYNESGSHDDRSMDINVGANGSPMNDSQLNDSQLNDSQLNHSELDIINSRIDGLYDKIVNIEEILNTLLNRVHIDDLDPSKITQSEQTQSTTSIIVSESPHVSDHSS